MPASKADADSTEETESLLARTGPVSPLHDTPVSPAAATAPPSGTSSSSAAPHSPPRQSQAHQSTQQHQQHVHQQQQLQPQQQSGTPRASAKPLTTSVNAEKRPLLQAASATLGSPRISASTSECGSSGKEIALCRICFEEDVVGSLEEPCACAGTQRFAHHACIQRWVEEKGHTKCEVCEQPYRGEFTVPPPPAMPLPVAGNVDLIVVDDDLLHHGGHLDLMDEGDQYYQRNPGLSWCFSFVIFIMFLVVIHHTMVVSDGMDDDDDGGGSDPIPGSGSDGSGDTHVYAASLTLFLFWVATKAFIIGLPLYTVMKIAARQAQREQYDAMLRAGAYDAGNRRMVLRVRTVRPMHADGTPAMVQLGPNAV